MNSYPHDEFDDVPEDSERRGAYRGQRSEGQTSRAGTLAIVVVGILGLLVGAVMFVVQPRTLAPDSDQNISAASSPSPSSTESPSSKPWKPSDINVQIFNAGSYPGAAEEVEKELESAGYQVTSHESWDGEPLPYSMVYYANGFIAEANTITDGVGFSYFEEQTDMDSDIYVVLGPDFPGLIPGSFEENTKAAASASASPTSTPAG